MAGLAGSHPLPALKFQEVRVRAAREGTTGIWAVSQTPGAGITPMPAWGGGGALLTTALHFREGSAYLFVEQL